MNNETMRPPVKEPDIAALWERLRARLAPLVSRGMLVAFSGGVDSALLLHAARSAGGRVTALTTVSASMPLNDLLDARAFCRRLGVPHLERTTHELQNPLYVANSGDRCYHCKHELFDLAREVADAEGLAHVLYGYTASDYGDDRPGHRAAVEHGVLFPLADAGLRKRDIRALMEHFNLPLADKPSSPCLASRIGRGVTVTKEHLRAVAALEDILRAAGLKVFRVRVNGSEEQNFIRVECSPEEMGRVLGVSARLEAEGRRRGYRWVTLDLGGYRMGGADR